MASFSASLRGGTDSKDDGAGAILDSSFAKDVACSAILQGLGEVLLGCVMAHQDYLQKL